MMSKMLHVPEKKFMMPTRREFIKGAGLAAVAAPLLAHDAKALLLHGSGAGPGLPTPAQPAIAAAYGFNTNTFWDDFVTLGTIDTHNTNSAGFNWYLNSGGYGGTAQPVDPASLSISNSVLTLDNPGPINGWLGTCGYPISDLASKQGGL